MSVCKLLHASENMCACVYDQYVCMYVYVCMLSSRQECVDTKMRVCIYVHMGARAYLCGCVRVCLSASLCVRTVFVCVSVCLYVCACAYICPGTT